MKKQFLETGKIVGTHGIRGELRVQPWSDSPAFLTGFSRFYLDPDGREVLEARSVRTHGNIVLLKAAGIESIESAERLRGRILHINREDVRLEEGRHFIEDLLGCRVLDADSGETLGELCDVSATGANDVWHIRRDGREYLVPAIPEVVISVDIEAEEIRLRPLKGIFEA